MTFCTNSTIPLPYFLYSFVKDYGEKKLENVNYHDVNIMGFAGTDRQKGERNMKIISSIFNHLRPPINISITDDNRVVLHRHSFMKYVREEGRRYQFLQKKGISFRLQLDITKIINECFADIHPDGI